MTKKGHKERPRKGERHNDEIIGNMVILYPININLIHTAEYIQVHMVHRGT